MPNEPAMIGEDKEGNTGMTTGLQPFFKNSENILDLKLHMNKAIKYKMHEKNMQLNYEGNWHYSSRQRRASCMKNEQTNERSKKQM